MRSRKLEILNPSLLVGPMLNKRRPIRCHRKTKVLLADLDPLCAPDLDPDPNQNMGMLNPWRTRGEGELGPEHRTPPGGLLTDSSSIMAAESKKSGLSSARSRRFLEGG